MIPFPPWLIINTIPLKLMLSAQPLQRHLQSPLPMQLLRAQLLNTTGRLKPLSHQLQMKVLVTVCSAPYLVLLKTMSLRKITKPFLNTSVVKSVVMVSMVMVPPVNTVHTPSVHQRTSSPLFSISTTSAKTATRAHVPLMVLHT